ncbi:PH domain-containing protein [Clostridium sp.]|uniref:PH domain-containing protein n=1 Tax=Clostridium sp. TaxID=1506 RepID=UPI001A38A071|nr:PH domain-containing protein [Clostridium sp.]MBK5241053.1 PH domain-containing protein [Clostridium sp.]
MEKISPYSRKMWTIEGLFSAGFILAIAVVLNIVIKFNALWKYALIGSIYGLVFLILIYSLFLPKYKYEKFRYHMDEEKIILKYGVFSETSVIIPMRRVQYVDTEQGLILKKFKLIKLTVHTAGGQHKIPYLENEIGSNLGMSITKIVQEKCI